MKIAAIVSTIEFQNRATIESISKKYGNIDVFLKVNIKDIFKKKTTSEHVRINYIYSIFPEKIRRGKVISNIENLYSKLFILPKLKKHNTVLLTNTHVAYLIPILNKKKIISLFVDPYSLMSNGITSKDEILMATKSDYLLCTSKMLASDYCRKHLGINVTGHYWPNTADLSLWNISKFKNMAIQSGEITAGYAGNMNEITINIPLVTEIVKTFPHIKFRFAGNINFKCENNKLQFMDIFSYKNAIHIGFIPYKEIQKEVSTWDLCLMLDNIFELSKYVHHNKVYQYLALGKIVLSTKTHQDYEELHECVLEAETIDDFIENMTQAISIARLSIEVDKRVSLAKENSADKRAERFMEIISN
ncbi:hypothetical protein ERW49_10580 [Aliivibrio finisterrensis]|uniref:Glycosyltransferase family 1 protein n=1 Tax=Aliivibrio finisterrensis TaxID=511998 RepID=A0A4Q5KL93_9GAMM|nr:hypothetical protein [Aliivibrio finisterrensis]RYU46106.1 hypothetical protein ERW49_10580 [Aliivibrio finisterrensis]